MCCARVVSTVRSFSFLLPPQQFSLYYRCTARKDDLDGGGGHRSREHTELLVSEFELGTLWDEYGLVGDIIVCSNLLPIARR